MNIKVITPQDMDNNESYLKYIVRKFNKKLKKKSKNDRYFIKIDESCDKITCEKIEKLYREVGWSDVKCETIHPSKCILQLYAEPSVTSVSSEELKKAWLKAGNSTLHLGELEKEKAWFNYLRNQKTITQGYIAGYTESDLSYEKFLEKYNYKDFL